MRAAGWWLGVVGIGAIGCNIDNPFETPEPSCEERGAWYADADGDGVGDVDGDVWLTCETPDEGWTQTPPDTDVDTDVDTDTTDTDG